MYRRWPKVERHRVNREEEARGGNRSDRKCVWHDTGWVGICGPTMSTFTTDGGDSIRLVMRVLFFYTVDWICAAWLIMIGV